MERCLSAYNIGYFHYSTREVVLLGPRTTSISNLEEEHSSAFA